MLNASSGLITITTTVATSITTTTTAATTNQSYYCSGVSPYTLWSMNGYGNVYMTINTSQCNFNSTPLYFTSMGGDIAHFTVGGYTAIYSPTKDSFTVYATPIISYTIAIMFNYSQTYRWNINWVGILE
ncbi:unnamed protein product [Adineta steineri]|uniref:Uncharacterized protein n=1 Tax=Adineta steineri TaxID=433720 RepID=A0A818NK34_9BILA|nr:unnamed protein product [Adineta steineri]CAF3829570.1 unnamed protein product [Adineta steineri]CAF3847210.1 unnamed protein product [Adineta steineri]